MAMTADNSGVDSINFLAWAKLFVQHMQDLRVDGHKILLVYVAYRAHTTLRFLKLFQENGIIAYALPAHTSGKTQAFDVVSFGQNKKRLTQFFKTHMNPRETERSTCTTIARS